MGPWSVGLLKQAAGNTPCPEGILPSHGKHDPKSGSCPLDLGRRKRDPLAFAKHIARRRRLAIDADQVVLRLAVRNAVVEQLSDCSPFGDLDVIGKAATVVVDVEAFHGQYSIEKERNILRTG
jgi:hypothetical protein